MSTVWLHNMPAQDPFSAITLGKKIKMWGQLTQISSWSPCTPGKTEADSGGPKAWEDDKAQSRNHKSLNIFTRARWLLSGPVAASAGILKSVVQALAASEAGGYQGPHLTSALRTHVSIGPVPLIQGLSKMQSNRHGIGGTRQNTSLGH